MLVVNDMFRSGRTNQTVVNVLEKRPEIDFISSATLFKFVEKRKYQKFDNLNFYAYELARHDIYLPWTTREKTERETQEKRIEMFKQIRRRPFEDTLAEMMSHINKASNFITQSSDPKSRFKSLTK